MARGDTHVSSCNDSLVPGDVYCELWSTEIRTSAGMPGVECLVYDNKKATGASMSFS